MELEYCECLVSGVLLGYVLYAVFETLAVTASTNKIHAIHICP